MADESQLEQKVLNTLNSKWVNHQDGYPRNIGNLAHKAGMTLSEFSRIQNKLQREGRYYPPNV